MGFSTSAVAALFLASSVLLFSTFYDAVNDSYDTTFDAGEDEEDRRNGKITTIVSVHSLTYDRVTSTMNISSDNDGSTVLTPSDAEVLVSGILETSSITLTRVNGASTDVWAPEDRALFTLFPITSIYYSTDVGSRFRESVTDNLASAADVYSADRIYVIDGTDIDVFDLEYDHDSTITDVPHLTSPQSISASTGHIYVQDNGNHLDYFTIGGTWEQSVNLPEMSNNLDGIDVGNSRILIADQTNGLVLLLMDGTYDATLSTNLASARDVACGDTRYYVVDNNDHIDVFTLSDNNYDAATSNSFATSGELAAPTKIAYLNDYIYILDDDGTKHIDIFDDDGTHVETITDDVGSAAAALDAGNRLLVSRGASGLNALHLGTKAKLVTDNGVSIYDTL